jgi:hypothetical protein
MRRVLQERAHAWRHHLRVAGQNHVQVEVYMSHGALLTLATRVQVATSNGLFQQQISTFPNFTFQSVMPAAQDLHTDIQQMSVGAGWTHMAKYHLQPHNTLFFGLRHVMAISPMLSER